MFLNKVVEELDKFLVITAVIAAPLLALLLLFVLPKTAYGFIYIQIPILLFFAGITYLVIIRRRLSSSITTLSSSGFHGKSSIYLILNILFVVFFTYSLISVMLTPEPYIRPLGYFISAAGIVAILAVEILFLPKSRAYTYILLAKILLLASLLRLTPMLIFPELVGFDPFYHRTFATVILETGHIPEGIGYTSFPMSHLMTVSISQLTGFDYRLAVISSLTFPLVVSLIFIFLLGRMFFNPKVGLLAGLLLATATISVEHGISPRPITLAITLMPIILYIIFKAKERRSISLTCLAIFLSAVTIITHTVGPFVLATVLFFFWGGFEMYKKLYRTKFETPVALGFCTLFVVAMFAWWMYATNFAIAWIARLIEWGFMIGYPWTPSAPVVQYMGQHEGQYMMAPLGLNLYFIIGVTGAFSLLAKELRNYYRFALAVTGLLLIAVMSSTSVLGLTGFSVFRWYPVAEVILAIPAAIIILLVCGLFKGNLVKGIVLASLVIPLSFLSITSTFTNHDSPIYLKDITARYSYTQSEVEARNTISEVYDGTVWTDKYYSGYLIGWPIGAARGGLLIRDLTTSLLSGDYEGIEGLVIIRKEILEKPFEVGAGVSKLDHDPREKLEQLHFNRIYESGGVTAFLWERQAD